MKGQHRILNEILIFAFGVAIASFIIISFGDMAASLETVTLEDQMSNVANTIRNGVVKAHATDANTIVRIKIPETLSNNLYRIKLNENNLTLLSFGGEEIIVSKQLFNMGETYNIISGDVVSSAGYIKIEKNGDKIEMKRDII